MNPFVCHYEREGEKVIKGEDRGAVVLLPHLEPRSTGHPPCNVIRSPSPTGEPVGMQPS